MTLLVAVIVLAACSSPFEPPPDFVAYLAGYGQVFDPEPAPPVGIIQAQEVLAKLRADQWPPNAPGAAGQATYGIVSCVDPAKNCAERGLVRPGETLAIWIVGYPDANAWATVDATTGAFINGDSP